MTLSPVLQVAAGGALGACARYLLTGFVGRALGPVFPAGTFVVNALGCLAFGLLVGFEIERTMPGSALRSFLLIGVLGGFTTFSAYSSETLALLEQGRWTLAAWSGLGQPLVGILAVWAGATFSRAL